MIYNAYQDSDKGIAGISIVSGGHIFAEQGRQIYRPNGRSDYLLFYVASGSEYMLLEREEVMEEGSFIFFRPFEKQIHIQKRERVSEFYYLHFNAPDVFDLFGFESSSVYSIKPNPNVKQLFEEIISELQTKQPAYEMVCVSKFFNILALLERGRRINEVHPLTEYSDKISYVIQKMNREFEKNYSLQDYADFCKMSKYHFLRIFKNITGTTPIEYRNRIRLEHAKELLIDSELTVSEIAVKVGFESNVYFCNAFKEHIGEAPSKFRNSQRKL